MPALAGHRYGAGVNPASEGKIYPDLAFEVTAERVAAFAAAVGADLSLGVPPTLATTAEFVSFPRVVNDPDLAMDFSRVVHGDQEYEYVRTPLVGETLTVKTRIASVRDKGNLGFCTIETQLLDAAGEPVLTARATMVERGE